MAIQKLMFNDSDSCLNKIPWLQTCEWANKLTFTNEAVTHWKMKLPLCLENFNQCSTKTSDLLAELIVSREQNSNLREMCHLSKEFDVYKKGFYHHNFAFAADANSDLTSLLRLSLWDKKLVKKYSNSVRNTVLKFSPYTGCFQRCLVEEYWRVGRGYASKARPDSGYKKTAGIETGTQINLHLKVCCSLPNANMKQM